MLKKRPRDGRIDFTEMLATKMVSSRNHHQAEGAGGTWNSTVAIKRLCITWNCHYQAALCYVELSLLTNGDYYDGEPGTA
jgi:hypothetical protein